MLTTIKKGKVCFLASTKFIQISRYMASIREVAKLAQVSPSTVSRALNGSGYVAEQTKEKIRNAVNELDYVPNQWIRNLYRKKTGIVGVMATEMIHPFFSVLWSHMEIELNKYGYHMMLCNTSGNKETEREYLDTLERNLFDGLIVGAALLPNSYYESIEKPILSLDRMIPGIPLVTSDHCQGGAMAAEKLLARGCKKILSVMGPGGDCRVKAGEAQVASSQVGFEFIRKMEGVGCQVVTESFTWFDVIDYNRSINRATEILKRNHGIDGIIATDLSAASFLKVSTKMKLDVPEQLKIIAYDGTYITDFNYKTISSVVQDVSSIAMEAVQVMLKLINKQPLEKEQIYVPVHYKKGDTI